MFEGFLAPKGFEDCFVTVFRTFSKTTVKITTLLNSTRGDRSPKYDYFITLGNF
jgi:hypothetical protein